ncbi:tetraacyldisaccharide 4'-kinase [Tenacibaculum piscium]|uniref:tetraacyldisaccharide 4'-kinase n=2 Tax=Tenacibaculum piscium TaxID=1458515 RepID=UPI00293E1B4D|nr:tetraacyldisaccharide 4'-kinase [Tenacibaculum piscium]
MKKQIKLLILSDYKIISTFELMKILRFLLFPFAILYGIITAIRNWFFDIGLLKSTYFDVPVIAVGNLSVGGTGKTPQIEFLIRLLKNTHKIAVLSRGYKRKTTGFQIVNQKHTACDVGDEPLQFYKKFKNQAIISVDADRTNGITQLLKKQNPPEIILLDDAFQHRKVKASTYILLTKFDDLYINDYMLPTGNLREFRSGYKRANIIIVTKCPENLSEEKQQEIIRKIKPKTYQQVFFTAISYDENLKNTKENIEENNTNLTISALKNKNVLLVTGIANPNSLLTFLSKENIQFKHLKYPDHYDFTNNDIQKITSEFKELEAKNTSKNTIILTTEKDFMRLENRLEKLCYISIKSIFLKDEKRFSNLIQQEISKIKV